MRARWQALPLQHRQYLARSVGIGVLLVFPFVDLICNFQLLNAVTDAAVFVVLALGLNIVVGYAGLLDLGYAAFFAIGAYTTGILTWPPHGLELNFWWAMLLSVPVAALFGVILGAPTLRVRGDYLAIITLAFGEIVPIAFRNLWHIDIRIGGWTHPRHRFSGDRDEGSPGKLALGTGLDGDTRGRGRRRLHGG